MFNKPIAYFLIIPFTLYTITGCSGKESIRSSEDNQIKFINNQKFEVKKEKLYSECLLLLQDRGYIVKLSDFEAGLISAELVSSSLITDDVEESKETNTCLNIISIILFVGFIIMIVSAFNNDYEDSETDGYYYENEYYQSSAESYQYNLTLTISSMSSYTAECRLVLIRSTAEEGIIISQTAVMNKYFNDSFFNELRKRLSL